MARRLPRVGARQVFGVPGAQKGGRSHVRRGRSNGEGRDAATGYDAVTEESSTDQLGGQNVSLAHIGRPTETLDRFRPCALMPLSDVALRPLCHGFAAGNTVTPTPATQAQ